MLPEGELEDWYLVDGKVYINKVSLEPYQSTLLCVVRVNEGYVAQVRALSKNETFRIGAKILRMCGNG